MRARFRWCWAVTAGAVKYVDESAAQGTADVTVTVTLLEPTTPPPGTAYRHSTWPAAVEVNFVLRVLHRPRRVHHQMMGPAY